MSVQTFDRSSSVQKALEHILQLNVDLSAVIQTLSVSLFAYS